MMIVNRMTAGLVGLIPDRVWAARPGSRSSAAGGSCARVGGGAGGVVRAGGVGESGGVVAGAV